MADTSSRLTAPHLSNYRRGHNQSISSFGPKPMDHWYGTGVGLLSCMLPIKLWCGAYLRKGTGIGLASRGTMRFSTKTIRRSCATLAAKFPVHFSALLLSSRHRSISSVLASTTHGGSSVASRGFDAERPRFTIGRLLPRFFQIQGDCSIPSTRFPMHVSPWSRRTIRMPYSKSPPLCLSARCGPAIRTHPSYALPFAAAAVAEFARKPAFALS